MNQKQLEASFRGLLIKIVSSCCLRWHDELFLVFVGCLLPPRPPYAVLSLPISLSEGGSLRLGPRLQLLEARVQEDVVLLGGSVELVALETNQARRKQGRKY